MLQEQLPLNSYAYVNAYVPPKFKEACILQNLQQDDTEWQRTKEEASAFQMPVQIRSLFATICTFCEPSIFDGYSKLTGGKLLSNFKVLH